jgi:hypothetical protein
MQVKSIVMDRTEQDKQTRNLSNEFVSKILVYAIVIEQQLTQIICRQLTKEVIDITDFVEYFDDVAFERKILLVELILRHNYPQLFTEYKVTFSQIKQIKDVRNRISHHSRSYAYDGKKTSYVLSHTIVRLERNSKGELIEKNVEKYTEKKMRGLMKMAETCDAEIRELTAKLYRLTYSS